MSISNQNIIDMNIGGVIYTSTVHTLTEKWPHSKLAGLINRYLSKDMNTENIDIPLVLDSNKRVFVDRDGQTFRHVLDFLRRPETDSMSAESKRNWFSNIVPTTTDRYRLTLEAEFYGLDLLANELRKLQRPPKPARCNSRPEIMEQLSEESSTTSKPLLKKTVSLPRPPKSQKSTIVENSTKLSNIKSYEETQYHITIGFRASYDTSRDMPTNDITRFRRINRITVAGRSDVAMQIFGEDLNDSRDPDRIPEGYTCRYYLKHNYLEMAYDTLASKGYKMINLLMLAPSSSNFSSGNCSNSYVQCEAVFVKNTVI